MREHSRIHRAGISVLAPLVLLLPACGYEQQTSAVRREPMDPEARRVAERVCGAVAPGLHGYRIDIDRSTGDRPLAYVDAVCRDGEGADVARLRWSAETGQLMCVSHVARRPADADRTELTRKQAALAAWRWMRIIGFASEAPSWRLAGTSGMADSLWWVYWEGEGGALRAGVAVQRRTGQLIQAMQWRVADPAARQRAWLPPATSSRRPASVATGEPAPPAIARPMAARALPVAAAQ